MRGLLLGVGAATVAVTVALTVAGPLTSEATADEAAVPPDVPLYERYGGDNGYYWSVDPGSTPGGEYGDPFVMTRIWSAPPGEGFTTLYRVERDNGKYFLTTDPAGEGAGPVTPLGYVGATDEAVDAVADGCRPTEIERYYLTGAVKPDGSVVPLDYHLYGESSTVSDSITADILFRYENSVGYVEGDCAG